MMGRTHMTFGLLAGILLLPAFGQPWYLFIPLAMLGSLLPDVDHENSKINKMIPLTRWIPAFFKHRGFFHSIFPVIGILVACHYFSLDVVGLPLSIGYLAHLLSDCLTKMGCNLLHPISTFRIQGFIETGGTMELFVFVGMIILNGLLLVRLFF